jgi:hypothetical protein
MIYEELPPPQGGIPQPEESGVPEKADELLQAARKRGRGLLEKQKNAAVEELGSVAGVMRDAARKFEEKEEAGVGDYVRKAADALERLSSTLKDRDLGDLVRDAEGALRRRPAVVLGATAVIGFALGRFLRAGSQKIAREVRKDDGGGTDPE